MTDKEKRLLVFLGLVVVVILFYSFAYKPYNAKSTNLKNEIAGLDAQRMSYQMEYLKKDQYISEIKDKEEIIEAVDRFYPEVLHQEMIIHVMEDLKQKILSMKLPGYGIGVETILATGAPGVTTEENTVPTSEELVYVPVTVDIELTYADLKLLLTTLRDYEQKLSVQNLNITSTQGNSTIRASFTLNICGLHTDYRSYVPKDYFGPFEEKGESIFAPFAGGSSDSEGITTVTEEKQDIILALSSIFTDRSNLVISAANDISGNSYLYADNKDYEPLEVVFEQEGENYYYRYKTSIDQFPKNGGRQSFDPQEEIRFKIESMSRVNDEDVNGVDLTVVNNTDLLLDLQIDSDDINFPRVNIVEQTGNISIYRYVD